MLFEWLAGFALAEFLAAMIELLGAIVIAGYCANAAWVLVQKRDASHAQLLVADGVLLGLSLKIAATLMKTVFLQSWPQISALAFVLALRTLLKCVFTWERERVVKFEKI